MNQLRVLKLGWEFPPLINGGLGIACHGLSTAGGQDVVTERAEYTTETYLKYGFSIDALYDDNVGQKVYEFSQALKVEAQNYEFDLIHAHDWMTYQAGVELKKLTGKPLVVHLHASQYDRAGPEAKGWIYEIERNGMQEADLVIPVSNYTASIVRDHYGIPEYKIATVHNGAEQIQSFKSEKKFPEKLVLFLGRLTDQKGPEFFLEIASLVLSSNPNVRFVMAGTGEKMRHLIETGAFKGLGGRFHFTGFLNKERVNTLLSMTDVYCMPSVSEPFGLSALEAAQFGIPAVISKQSGVAEILKAALKADFWDTELMAKHINDLLTDEGLHKKVVADADRDIKAATWDAAATRVLSLYQRVLSR